MKSLPLVSQLVSQLVSKHFFAKTALRNSQLSHTNVHPYKGQKRARRFFKKKWSIFFYKQFCAKNSHFLGFLKILSRTRGQISLIIHILIVLIIIYNFSIGAKVRKWLFLDLTTSICAINDFFRKMFKIEAQNFPEMYPFCNHYLLFAQQTPAFHQRKSSVSRTRYTSVLHVRRGYVNSLYQISRK